MFDENERQIEVNFRSGCQIDSTAKFTTSDENLQNALEKCSGFNRDFYLESTREDNPVTETVKAVEEKVVDEKKESQKVNVADKGEAIDWLKEHYPSNGYTAVKLRTKEAFEAACKECNVEFVF